MGATIYIPFSRIGGLLDGVFSGIEGFEGIILYGAAKKIQREWMLCSNSDQDKMAQPIQMMGDLKCFILEVGLAADSSVPTAGGRVTKTFLHLKLKGYNRQQRGYGV
jgi:hypothetical protein